MKAKAYLRKIKKEFGEFGVTDMRVYLLLENARRISKAQMPIILDLTEEELEASLSRISVDNVFADFNDNGEEVCVRSNFDSDC